MTQPPLAASVQRAYTADLDAQDLYRMLRLRIEVFVVEQECPYLELDGRDLEGSTRHFWVEPGGGEVDGPGDAGPDDTTGAEVVGYLRLLRDPDGLHRIGRVCVAKSARGAGLARKLMHAALADVHGSAVELSAQTYALGFYRSFGFVECGEEYMDDGIPHVLMRREPSGRA